MRKKRGRLSGTRRKKLPKALVVVSLLLVLSQHRLRYPPVSPSPERHSSQLNSPPEISLANPHHWGLRRLGSDSAIYANSSCSSPDQFHSRGSLSLSPKRAHRQSGVSHSPQRSSDTLTQSEFSERRGKRPASRGSLSLSRGGTTSSHARMRLR